MDIFMSNMPYHASVKEVKEGLEPYVNAIHVLAYSVRLFGGNSRGKGILTLPTIEAGQRFLHTFGPLTPVNVMSRRINCKRSDKPLDRHKVQSLFEEQQRLLAKRSQTRTQPSISARGRRDFEIDQIECGVWSTEARDVPIFESYYSLKVAGGKLQFGSKAVQVNFSNAELDSFDPKVLGQLLSVNLRVDKRISIMYFTMTSIITSGIGEIILTLVRAPKMYRQINMSSLRDASDLPELLRLLGVKVKVRYGSETTPWERVSSLDEAHGCFAPFAFVYRFRLKNRADVSMVQQLDGRRGIPEIVSQRTDLRSSQIKFVESFSLLATKLQREFEFPVAFQLNALFANGMLPPSAIIRLLPYVSRLASQIETTIAANILQDFLNRLYPADPLGEIDALSDEALLRVLNESIGEASKMHSVTSGAIEENKYRAGMTYIYHASITPAGCYFYGPKLETLNRVLRKYPEHHEYFLRVTFCDEDGDQMQFEPKISSRPIFDGQYRHYLSLEHQIVVAGRAFQFLGFSSSSLRSQSCWFMAPFTFEGERLDAAKVIAKLGDFSGITCPGRCAARIGQAFSDTVSSIDVPEASQFETPDIERDNRIFSDGCGTISNDLLERIWAMSEKKYRNKPTVLQIRFAGAKGVVSLDERLEGSQLCLRDSMIKFRGSTDYNIEICSSAGWLPMVLNRPLIKVLEDLGVEDQTFIDLQQDAIDELHRSTTSTAFAANFLKRQRVGPPSIRLPWMVEALDNIGFNFRDDKFLERAFELGLLTALRDLKHKARIPVPDGVTLMGIVDETGVLEEGEIYCPFKSDDKGEGLVTGHVLITRSPVHHPGDVQMAVAVTDLNIPEYSPLKALKNCVVFSQKGFRDLPSKLAGGDLDGDLYNIVYDSRFSLRKLYNPAEYPRVPPQDLGRPVTSEDIVDFLIDFMKNNILGLISNRHLTIADQQEEGVNHPDCLKLAQMASTAVDFPKTGVKVEKDELPRCSPIRPDFMAPGPRMFVQKDSTIEKMEENDEEDGDDDVAIQYYKSPKILGRLYRAIDETKFIQEMQAEIKEDQRGRVGVGVLDAVWDYLEKEIPQDCDWDRPDRLVAASDIKESYERNMLSLMRNYSDTPWKANISEAEVFIGSIVGREKQTKRQKEASANMREEYEDLTSSIVESIKGGGREDTLAVGMNCLCLCRQDRETPGPQNGLRSFAWVVNKERKELDQPPALAFLSLW